MKKVYVIMGLAVAAITLSCQKTSDVLVNEPDIRTFTCAFDDSEDPASKVDIASDGKTTWEI